MNRECSQDTLRYVVQEHDAPQGVHWDLMLEQGDHLATWQVPVAPEQWGDAAILCPKIFDHRLRYLEYEGPLTQDRGAVRIVARGGFRYVEQRDDFYRLQMTGDLTGELQLERDGDAWLMTLERP